MWIMWFKLINLCTQQFMSLNMSIEGPGTGHSRQGCQTDCAHYLCLTRPGVLPIKISHLQIVEEREPAFSTTRTVKSFSLLFPTAVLCSWPLAPLTPGYTNINITKLATRAPFVSSSACLGRAIKQRNVRTACSVSGLGGIQDSVISFNVPTF